MATVRTLQRSFGSGIVSPELYGRIDLQQYQNGVATANNFVILPHGPARMRNGTEMVRSTYLGAAGKSRLIPFVFNQDQSFVIELSAGNARLHRNGGTVMNGTLGAWSAGAWYSPGDIVTDGVAYVCIVANTGLQPSLNAVVTSAGSGNPEPAAPFYWRPLVYTPNVNPLFGYHVMAGSLVEHGGVSWYAKVAQYPMLSAPSAGPLWAAVGSATTITPFAAPAPYTIAVPYTGAELFDVHYTQSADVVTLVHPMHPPLEISRHGSQQWAVADILFSPLAQAPLGAYAATPTGAGAKTYTYVATTAPTPDYGDGQESLPSAPFSCTNDLAIAGQFNTLTCVAQWYTKTVNLYKLDVGGMYGYIGQFVYQPGFDAVSFVDDNITPDIAKQPPNLDTTLSSGPNFYPAAVGYFEQRRWFGGWKNGPQSVIATRSGTESSVVFSTPTRADDRLSFRMHAREGSTVQHIVPVQQVILFTGTNEFKVASTDGGAITGATLSVRPQAYVGASNVQPLVLNSGILYAQSRGGRLRSMEYNWQAQGYLTNEVNPVAPHLFDGGQQIADMAFQRAPYPMAWLVNTLGQLVGLTYMPEQQAYAWHTHTTTGGMFESCCVVPEQGEDYLYVVVLRTVGGVAKRFIERFRSHQAATLADNFYVDCGGTYTGAPATTISGLDWLEGATVNILADGATVPPQVVTGGAITLAHASSTVHVGLPITADLQTLPFAFAGQGDLGQGRPKNVNRVFLKVVQSSGIKVGPSADKLVAYAQRTTEPYGFPPGPVTGEVEVVLDNSWGMSGQVFIRQTDPLPLTITSATVEVAVGG